MPDSATGLDRGVPDNLLRPLGTSGVHTETVTASGNGAGFYVGAGRRMDSIATIGGPVTGTSPTLDMKYQESDTLGGSYTDIPGGAHAQKTAADTGLPGRITFRTTKDYIRAVKTIGGSATPTFNLVSLQIVPLAGGVI